MTKNESEGNVVQIRCIKLSTEQASGLWRKTSLYSKFTNSIPNSKYQKTFYQLKVSDDLRAEINCLLAANCSAASRWQQNSFNSLTEREGGDQLGRGGESIALSVNKAVSDWVVLPAGHPCRPIFYTYLFYINCSISLYFTKPFYQIFTYFITVW